jgi:Domain of unknown function (DUF4149)
VTTLLGFLRLSSLGIWIGAIFYFAAIVTRGAFALLSRDQAGLLVGFTLRGLHVIGLIAAAIFVISSLALRKSLRAFVEPAVLGVILMAALTAASQYRVMPQMDALQRQMGSVDATPSADPRRAEFDRLHSVSVDLEGAVLVMGLASLFLAVRRTGRPDQSR